MFTSLLKYRPLLPKKHGLLLIFRGMDNHKTNFFCLLKLPVIFNPFNGKSKCFGQVLLCLNIFLRFLGPPQKILESQSFKDFHVVSGEENLGILYDIHIFDSLRQQFFIPEFWKLLNWRKKSNESLMNG